jgi:OOP family OmpA-OmpF porin
MKASAHFLLLGFILGFVGACATAPSVAVPPGSTEEVLNQLAADLADAQSRDVDVLSPGFYKAAQASYVKAKQGVESGAKLSAINRDLAEGLGSLQRAEELAEVSRTILGETNAAREKALAVNADELGKPFHDAEQQYLRLTKAIEKDNLSYAQKHAADVQASFQALEIMAIKNNALKETRDVMASAEKNKIDKIAPMAYNDAYHALSDADNYIGSNPYDTDTIQQKSADAQFMAQRLLSISESSKKFEAMTPEASALYVESLFAQLGNAARTGDIRNQPVEDQLDTLAGAAENMHQRNQALERENQDYQAEITELRKLLVGVQGYSREQEAAKRKLAAEQAFAEQFNTVQHYFNPDEAEVYKQGNQLVIRLRGITFPVGQATLSPDNYVLLGKVQQAIQTFGQPTVTVEGHTDSTGSATTNQKLSQQRADAVKAYLVANRTIPKNRIQAVGYGPDRPLAPNTTAKGRAINRRIDVVIDPVK